MTIAYIKLAANILLIFTQIYSRITFLCGNCTQNAFLPIFYAHKDVERNNFNKSIFLHVYACVLINIQQSNAYMINSTNDCQLTKTKKTLVGSYKNDDKNHHQTHMLNISPLNRFPPISTTYLSMEKLLMTDN